MSTATRVLVAVAATIVFCIGLPAAARAAPATVVRIPVPQDEGSLTPYTFKLAYPLVTLIYDTLLWRDLNGVPRPWLARSADTSADGRTVTIKLVSGVLWQDGVALTAADVVFTFHFVATHPHPRFTPQLSAVDTVTSVDSSTVIIHLRQASPGFVDQPLSDLPILPAHIWEKVTGAQLAPPGLPVGSGPYRLTAYQPDVGYQLQANPDYFRGRPAVDSIEVPIMSDPTATITALETAKVDMLPESLPPDDVAGLAGATTRIVTGPSYLGTVLLFNLRRAPFDRPEVRQAIAAALDLQRIAAAAGNAEPALHGLLHPESPWAPAAVLHTTDFALAQRQLANLHLPALKILVPDNDASRQEAGHQVALALQRVGLQASTEPLPHDALTAAVGSAGASNPSFDLAIWTTPPLASYDPDFTAQLFGSSPAVATLNVSGYSSATFDQLAQRVATTSDTTARRAAVADELRLLATDSPVVPLFFATGAYAYRPVAYQGWQFVRGTGIFDKQSFLVSATSGTTAPPTPVGGLVTTGSDGLPFGWIAVGLLGVALAIAATTLVRRRH